MIDHMLLHCIVNGQLGYPGFQAGDVMRSDRFWPISAGHAHESCWSNPMQMTGPLERKRMGKSVH
ncbi:hypothetical protein C8K66_10774 [Pseudomonas sp. GV105]|uniref:hypothetical protein n=1 Tax=Pseudomonas sp. GV105 TaxID=2135759 RepID=UPI000D36B75D|nr:hypothetical protein [Pseudomonas sp. GV105]PUB31180.1 hypothetical protein C8K66_10774 [Pseudomonas sp. GV105]